MPGGYQPNFKNFQQDIERYLIRIGKSEKQSDGMIIFHGYDHALQLMFKSYLEQGALQPLVRHFRIWNWEWSYNTYLLELTAALKAARDWDNLLVLWDKGVVRARKKHYNDTWKINKNQPGALKPGHLKEVGSLLLQSLGDVQVLAREFGTEEDLAKYSKMIIKVEKGKRA